MTLFFFSVLFSEFTKRCGSESMDIHGGSSKVNRLFCSRSLILVCSRSLHMFQHEIG